MDPGRVRFKSEEIRHSLNDISTMWLGILAESWKQAVDISILTWSSKENKRKEKNELLTAFLPAMRQSENAKVLFWSLPGVVLGRECDETSNCYYNETSSELSGSHWSSRHFAWSSEMFASEKSISKFLIYIYEDNDQIDRVKRNKRILIKQNRRISIIISSDRY